MREILFRGKNEYSGEWVCGSLHIEYGETDILGNRNIDYRILGMHGECDYVIPESVGQFTGLTDKNGKKIFEGDIVKTDKFSEPNKQYIVKYDLQFGAFIGQDKYNMYFVTYDGDSDQFEVIGNIHDNPELLKGENNG